VVDSLDRAGTGPMVEAALSAPTAGDVRRIVRDALGRT